jgi:hypothetical protein
MHLLNDLAFRVPQGREMEIAIMASFFAVGNVDVYRGLLH